MGWKIYTESSRKKKASQRYVQPDEKIVSPRKFFDGTNSVAARAQTGIAFAPKYHVPSVYEKNEQ